MLGVVVVCSPVRRVSASRDIPIEAIAAIAGSGIVAGVAGVAVVTVVAVCMRACGSRGGSGSRVRHGNLDVGVVIFERHLVVVVAVVVVRAAHHVIR